MTAVPSVALIYLAANSLPKNKQKSTARINLQPLTGMMKFGIIHSYMNDHGHHEISGRKLFWAVLLNFVITIAEFVGGLISGSLSLLSDALHNLSDGVALIISYLAFRLSKRESTLRNTFGFKRAEILAALFNAAVLVIIIFFLFREAYHRFMHPVKINGVLMISVAFVGLIANLIAVILLKKDATYNLNIKSSYLHLLADTFSSVGVIIGGIFIYFLHITWIDPVLTVIIGLYILRESYTIVKQTVNILMQATPEYINVLEIKKTVEALPEVHNLHHVHVWQANDKDIFFEGHVDVCEDFTVSKSGEIHERIEKLLSAQFGIYHSTIQIEYGACKNKDIVKTCT